MSVSRFLIVISIFLIVAGCSKKNDPVPSFRRSDLIGKAWAPDRTEYILDGKTYSEKDTLDQDLRVTFQDSGTFLLVTGGVETVGGYWDLEDNILRIAYPDGDVEAIHIFQLNDQIMTLIGLDNLDITVQNPVLTSSEENFLDDAIDYFRQRKLDWRQSKRLSIRLVYVVK